MSYNNYLASGAPRSFLKTSFLHRCLIITSKLGSGAPRGFLLTSLLHRCLIITSFAQVPLEVSYELVSYIDVL